MERGRALRQPSGDGAIIALFGGGVDAASMVEPYATMLEELGVGRVVRRTGDVWPGAPGCSLATTRRLRAESPELVAPRCALARGVGFVRANPDEAAEIAHRYIGVGPRFIASALRARPPRVEGIANQAVMDAIIALMRRLGYLNTTPSEYVELAFVEALAGGTRVG